MQDLFAIDIKDPYNLGSGTYSLYVSSNDLLAWAQSAVLTTFGSAGGLKGTGTEADPYKPAGVSGWLQAWDTAAKSKAKTLYFEVAARKIRKAADGGHGGHADGFYMSDLAFSGTGAEAAGHVWNRADGASYREFGKFIHDGTPIAPMEGVVWSQRIASNMRTLLKGVSGAHAGPATVATDATKTGGSKWRVDMSTDEKTRKAPVKLADATPIARTDALSALPLLTSVMFISEPARNPRAWLMGLMLLDLMGAQYEGAVVTKTTLNPGRHFTFERALVHPSRLDRPGWKTEQNMQNEQPVPLAWAKKQGGKSPQKSLLKPGSAAVEGLYPPSPKWSARTKNKIDVANDYIQQKEVAVICQWLDLTFNRYMDSAVITGHAIGAPGTRQNAVTTSFPRDPAMKGFGKELATVMTQLFAMRAGSFNSLGMLLK